MINKRKLIHYVFWSLVLAPSYLQAAPVCKQWVAKIASTQGQVDVKYYQQDDWVAAPEAGVLCGGDTVRTGKYSRVVLTFTNKAVASIDQNATLIFPSPTTKSQSWLMNLIDGTGFFRSRRDQDMDINTPFVNAVHKGTEFLVAVGHNKAVISVLDGAVSAQNSAGQLLIKQGLSAEAHANQAPQLRALSVTSENAVQWTLYYPPIADYKGQALSSVEPLLRPALQAYQQGHVTAALDLLANIPDKQQTTGSATLMASLLLTVGRLDDAQPLINQVLKREPSNSAALALRVIIAVAQNKTQQALQLAQQAVALNPQSDAAYIALSYAYQAQFKVEEALKAAQRATELAANNALAWARLSELQLSVGDRHVALQSAQHAEVLNANLARIQTIKGFAALAEHNIVLAEQVFTRAISLDSSDPIARLGGALVKIRQGLLEEGKSELEIAVNLDPNNAVLRSYLGKSFYELRNKDYAAKELEIAKAMDAKDSTPWFYDAILKQTTNRPIEALHDMQKAIELNDNRGVYRSSLLLDKDLAARSAAQGRIYNELGFQQQGLLEGWKSVNRDANNYSAHRLLADNYAALPRHEIARVSELLQSQLLQPVNITPIQPHLSESNLFILNGLGPSDLSNNEFNPLFEYNRVAVQASGLYGGNNTWGENVALSGIHNNVSFSFGQFHYQTDGFRKNDFLKKDLYNVFVQGQINDKLNLQAEYKHEERENGDLSRNFNANFFSHDFLEKRNIDNIRIGGSYIFNKNSSLIGSVIYHKGTSSINDKSMFFNSQFPYESKTDFEAAIPAICKNIL